ncbi:MAG: tyrosine-protein kinase Etk/Wzc [Cocleimonas sp.]|jgi:tyrosine-protein kinase Etk/Wzc
MNGNNGNFDKKIEDDEIDLLELFRALLNGKWLILFFTILATLAAFIYAFGKAPIYKADTLLQVETKKAGIPGLEDIAGLSGDDTSVGTELELIKSRKILGEAVKELSLDIIVGPKRIPLLGNLNKRFLAPDELSKLPSISESIDALTNKFAWSNEDISISSLEVSSDLLNKGLTLTARTVETYDVTFDDKVILKDGKVNQSISSPDGFFSIHVNSLNALPGTQFVLTKLSTLSAIERLQNSIQASEKGKKTGIISLKLEGENKQKIVNVLDKISKTYIQQNKSRSSEEASNALKFLEEQIKPVEEKADIAEANLQKYRTNNQTANMSVETLGVLELVSEIDTELQKLSLKRDELILKYTPNHPVIQSISAQEAKLEIRKKETLSKIKKLPQTQQQLLKLEGDYKVANSVYLDLVNNIQEFKIAKASTVGNAYIVDAAVVHDKPVKPKKALILALGALLGGMLGTLLVFIRKALHQTVNDPEKLESHTGLSVYATIPLTKAVQVTGGLNNKRQKILLAQDKPNDPSIESLRSLRTSLHFALLEAKNNIVMITGSSPSIGKSFVSSNFAAVIAASEQRVLLIDGDMRKGYLHKLLTKSVTPGLSDLISGKATIDETIHTTQVNDNNLDIITRGQTPPNPSELLMHSNFGKILNELSGKYDLIIIDTPPVHAVTDPMIIGQHCGVIFMVVRSDQHSMKEIEHAVTRLSQNGVDTKGFIFNGFVNKSGANGYGGYGYQSYYGDYKSDK